jgi:hypothetical protein
VDGVAATFALLGSLCGLIHCAVGFPPRIEGYCVTPLEQIRTYFCALQPADSRMCPHQEQRINGGSQRATSSLECAPIWPNLNFGASRTPRCYVGSRMFKSGRALTLRRVRVTIVAVEEQYYYVF